MIRQYEAGRNKLKEIAQESISKIKITAVLTDEGKFIPVDGNEVKIEPTQGTLEVTHFIIDGNLYEVEQ